MTTLPTIPPERVLLTKSDLAKLLQVSPRHIEKLVQTERLPRPIRLGSLPRWRRAELFSFLDSLRGEKSNNANSRSDSA